MFENVKGLTSLAFKDFKTKDALRLSSMFEGMESLESIDISGIDLSIVEFLDSVFKGDVKLTTIKGFVFIIKHTFFVIFWIINI